MADAKPDGGSAAASPPPAGSATPRVSNSPMGARGAAAATAAPPPVVCSSPPLSARPPAPPRVGSPPPTSGEPAAAPQASPRVGSPPPPEQPASAQAASAHAPEQVVTAPPETARRPRSSGPPARPVSPPRRVSVVQVVSPARPASSAARRSSSARPRGLASASPRTRCARAPPVRAGVLCGAAAPRRGQERQPRAAARSRSCVMAPPSLSDGRARDVARCIVSSRSRSVAGAPPPQLLTRVRPEQVAAVAAAAAVVAAATPLAASERRPAESRGRFRCAVAPLARPWPPDYGDDASLPEQERERRRLLRAVFACGGGPDPADLTAADAEEVARELELLERCAWDGGTVQRVRRPRVRMAVRQFTEAAELLQTLRYTGGRLWDPRGATVNGMLEMGAEVLGLQGHGTACVGGASAGAYLTYTSHAFECALRFAISFESEIVGSDDVSGRPAGSRVYHRVLGIGVAAPSQTPGQPVQRKFGALGHSRHPGLCCKSLAYPTIAALLIAYQRSYSVGGHRLLSAKLGRLLPPTAIPLPAPPEGSVTGGKSRKRAVLLSEEVAGWMVQARTTIAAQPDSPVHWQIDVDMTSPSWRGAVRSHEERLLAAHASGGVHKWPAPVEPYRRTDDGKQSRADVGGAEAA
eukprot:TRINITY_DN8335_c0_g1_i1.p1 TRINITY_DN8335_c0_g1~~TRINITY_DN8335_c0_g1_i1.p1  ORF type:complete len:639 (+),score=247.29 TRINITY_DN8335_c0_g1_i1:45-1961(+)